MILVAHLFGSRVDLAPLARPGVLLVEDCAQSFRGPGARGDPPADVSLFSFGSIKTATALGGALVRVEDAALRARMRELNDAPCRCSRAPSTRGARPGSPGCSCSGGRACTRSSPACSATASTRR